MIDEGKYRRKFSYLEKYVITKKQYIFIIFCN